MNEVKNWRKLIDSFVVTAVECCPVPASARELLCDAKEMLNQTLHRWSSTVASSLKTAGADLQKC